jgi:hypothetical protein
MPSKQPVAGSNPAGRAELRLYLRKCCRRDFCGLLRLLRQLLIGLDAIGLESAALGCVNIGAYLLATLATALRQQITGDRIAAGAVAAQARLGASGPCAQAPAARGVVGRPARE